MKKTFASFVMLFVAVAALSLHSCSKDPEDLLKGKWGLERLLTIWEESTFDNTEALKEMTLEFREDGSVLYFDGKKEVSGSWMLSESSLTLDIEGERETFKVDNLEKKAMTLEVTEVENEIASTMVMDFKKL